MSNEEEAMELSGESNLVSNLHNFSFDVSWSHKDLSPPTQRRPLNVLSPARFNMSTPKSIHNWKLLTLKEKQFSPVPQSKVKLSQKSVATYHDNTKPLERRQSYSPMELDQSDPKYDFNVSEPVLKKRHSDVGMSYTNNNNNNKNGSKQKPIPKMQQINESTSPRRRTIDSPISNTSSLEDSVFFRDSHLMNKKSSAKRNHRDKLDDSYRRRLTQPDSMSQSSCIVLVVVLLVCSTIMGYIFFQMSWCSVFDVDTVKLGHKLEDNVFGQHIAVKTVVEVLENFEKNIRNKQRKRTLVLSFHGWTGIGKNYVSKFIAEAFYNARVSLYLGPLHLMDRYNTDGENQIKPIKNWILGNITTCGVNVVIIDEIDKAERGYLDSIESAIETLQKKSATKSKSVLETSPISVFILLSNSRSSQINHFLFSQMLVDRERDLIRKSEFDEIFDDSQSEWYKTMKDKGLVDVFVPFLPLAEGHVKQCIERNFVKKGRNPSESLILSVMEELSFVDMGGKSGQISLTGCKRVEDKVNLHLYD